VIRRALPAGATIAAAILLAGCGLLARFSRADVPDGWRRPEPDETAQAWRDDSPHRYLRVRADFTGDGLVDEAAFLVEVPETRLVLVKLEARKDGPPTIDLIDDLGDLAALEAAGIDLVPPGVQRVMCNDLKDKACGPPDHKRPLTLTTPAVTYFKPDSASRLLYWNPTTRQLDHAWTSD
jgi:hypothetical protein